MTMDIDIPGNERVFIGGQTASGKSYLAKYILRPSEVTRLVVLDVKKNLGEAMELEPATPRNWAKLIRGKPMRLQVSHALSQDFDLIEYYNEQLRRAFVAANVRIYVDELLDVVRNSQSYPFYLRAAYTRGREPIYNKQGEITGGNIGTIAASQRPANIPTFALESSKHFFIFRLTNEDDREKIAGYTHPMLREPVPKTDDHGFYYFAHGMREPIYVPKLEVG